MNKIHYMGLLLIVGMAIAPIAVNNAVSLGHIIGKLNEGFSSTPNETYRGKNLKLRDEYGIIILWDPDTRFSKMFFKGKSLFKTTYGSDGMTEVNVFHKNYQCVVSWAFYQKEDLCTVGKELAMSEYKTTYDWNGGSIPFLKKITRVPVIKMPSNTPMRHFLPRNEVCFVFNFNEERKHALLSLLLGLSQGETSFVASEVVVEGVVPCMGGIMQSQDKIVFDNPQEYLRCEYNGELPELMSKPQVRKLYDLGIIKMAKFDTNRSIPYFFILSDDAFDNDPEKSLERIFGNKEAMHEYIEEMLEKTL